MENTHSIKPLSWLQDLSAPFLIVDHLGKGDKWRNLAGLCFSDYLAKNFFLERIGSGPWTTSHYNWWLNPPGMRPDPLAELGAGSTGITLPVELVDAFDGAVTAARTFFISTEPAAILRKCVLDQIASVLDPWDHLDTAGRVLGRFGDLSWMAIEALWLECGRPDQSCECSCSCGTFSCAGCT